MSSSVAAVVEAVDPPLERRLTDLAENGFTVIEHFLDQAHIERIRNSVKDVPVSKFSSTFSNSTRMAPDKEVGGRTIGFNLVAKTRCCDELLTDPRLLAIVEGHLGKSYQLSISTLLNVHPGEGPQQLHQDDYLFAAVAPRPHRPFVCNFLVAIDGFDEENGGTLVIPKSHLWPDGREPKQSETVQICMPSGSVLAWTGSLWHGGGGNKTSGANSRPRLALNANFNLFALKQHENQFLGIPKRELDKMPQELQRILGFRVDQGNLNIVDGMDPLVAKRADAVVNPKARPDPHGHGVSTSASHSRL